MVNHVAAIKARMDEHEAETRALLADVKAGKISDQKYAAKRLDKAFHDHRSMELELEEAETLSKAAANFSWGTEVDQGISGDVSGPGVADYGRIMAPSPMDMTAAQVQGLMTAAQHRTPFSVEIPAKSFKDGVRTKAAVTEAGIGGSFGGQLPPVQSLYAVGLGYEPTRISDLLPGAAMPGPSATFLRHTANANEAGNAAEGASKVDLGPSISEVQVLPTKIAGTATCTLEVWQDTEKYGQGAFAQWLPVELTRSLVNSESAALLNAVNGTASATFNGITQTAGTLTRAIGSDSPLDCLAKAYADIRVGAAFADPDLVLMHPTTLSALRRAKDAEGRYLLNLLSGPLDFTPYGEPSTPGPAKEPNSYSIVPQGTNAFSGNLWGAQIAATTQVAAGTAVVMSVRAGAGIYWQRLGMLIFFNPWSLMTSNEYFWVAEERIAFSCPRPAAVNIVTGLPTS